MPWSGPNTAVARVYNNSAFPPAVGVPEHRFVMATEDLTIGVNNNADGNLTQGWHSLGKRGGGFACPSIAYLPSDGYYYVISGGHTVDLQRSRDLQTWEKAGEHFIQNGPADAQITALVDGPTNIAHVPNASVSLENRSRWDHDANDGDFCCESWGGAKDVTASWVVWGADGQGASGWKAGPEGFAAIGTANVTLDALLQSYFSRAE